MNKKKVAATSSARAARRADSMEMPRTERRVPLKRKVLSRNEPGFNQRLVIVD
ncbi:MAG: hypothetical protein H6948_13520 [Zoogloeaceae bacterium]|nr:hypothetical protein [Planctomycetales bacterium]MCP5233078.1 hypothetical protein [Zoogloeaceae bacterium]